MNDEPRLAILKAIVDIQDGELNKQFDDIEISSRIPLALQDIRDYLCLLIDEGYLSGLVMASGEVNQVQATPSGRLALKQHLQQREIPMNGSNQIEQDLQGAHTYSDMELQSIVLNAYYSRRRENWVSASKEKLGINLEKSEILRVSQQLADLGLIEFRGGFGNDKLQVGVGKITAYGVTLAEDDQPAPQSKTSPIPYVDSGRLKELRQLASPNYDLSKLIRVCEELNIAYSNQCYFSMAMLIRAILDHVPPIFGKKSFGEVANNYQSKGRIKNFKTQMLRLHQSSRDIADAQLHAQIRQRETLPNRTQVNFSSELDVLLAEIEAILRP